MLCPLAYDLLNSFSAGMLNAIMLVVREAEYNARYTLAAGGGEFRPSLNRPKPT